MLLLVAACMAESEWHGCESFPGFGSANDIVQLGPSSFNISTADYLTSRSCDAEPDLLWSHYGTFSCNATSVLATFVRHGLYLEPRTTGGLLFGRVLCPRLKLQKGVRTWVDLESISTECSSVTFNNCAVYYDALAANSTVLQRSKAPSCKPSSKIAADGPPLRCATESCVTPCI